MPAELEVVGVTLHLQSEAGRDFTQQQLHRMMKTADSIADGERVRLKYGDLVPLPPEEVSGDDVWVVALPVVG